MQRADYRFRSGVCVVACRHSRPILGWAVESTESPEMFQREGLSRPAEDLMRRWVNA